MLDQIKNQIPAYAKDLKLNLSSLMREEKLTATQRAGVLFASALAAGNSSLIFLAEQEAREIIDDVAELENAKAANAVMGMTNIYYRFLHMAKDKEYGTMPAGLRMNVVGRPPADKVNFELYSLAVSAINGCEFCIAAHDEQLKKAGLSREGIQQAIRIASTVHAVASVLGGETALAQVPDAELAA
jgi:alkyl hydroperoxide reductase subunit D